MPQPQVRLVCNINDTATLPSIQWGGSEANGSGLGIRGSASTIIMSVGGSDLLTLSSSALTLGSGVSLAMPVQDANKVFAGPETGADAAPTFRALVAADIPSLNYVSSATVRAANLILAGPATGANSAPTFRAVVKADIDPVIKVFTSSASAGGGATEAMVLTGLLSTDTILAVSQSVPGANSLPLLGYNTLANDALTAVWSADPGANAVIKVVVMR